MGKRIAVGIVVAALFALVSPGVSGAATAQGPPPGSPYSFYVGCSGGVGVAAAELCDRDGRPSAFFESPGADVEYEICVDPPGGGQTCQPHQFAAAGTLYENSFRATRPGQYYVIWSVGGVEVGSWILDVEQVSVPLGSKVPVLACSRSAESPTLTFSARPAICTEFRHFRIDAADEIWMSRLRWRDWGARHAFARGRWKNCSTGSCRSGPVKLVAINPQPGCGLIAYTRLRILVIGLRGTRRYSDAPPTC